MTTGRITSNRLFVCKVQRLSLLEMGKADEEGRVLNFENNSGDKQKLVHQIRNDQICHAFFSGHKRDYGNKK